MTGSVTKARRDAGRCIDCGGEAPRSLRRVTARAKADARKAGLPLARFLYEALCNDCLALRRNRAAAKAARKERHRKKEFARRHARFAAGSCVRCGRRAPAARKRQCQPCREAARAARVKRLTARQAAGLCPECGKRPPRAGRVACQPCAAADAERCRARRLRMAARKAAGLDS